MEIEPSPPIMAKKLWNTVRIMFYMLRKGISKSKFLVDLRLMMLKQGKITGKTITNLMLHHHYSSSTFTCRPNDIHMSYISPQEYEFSCSNSPVYPSYYPRRKHHHHHHHRRHDNHRNYHYAEEVSVVQSVEASPLWLPGFGRSPLVRQLRVTDSPFPLKEIEEDTQVDKAAEDFIKKFYKELNQQKRMATVESPSPYHKWAR